MKFLYGYFHPETGESVVALADKYDIYIGEAKLHPDDKKYASELCGCRLAQGRAWLQALIKELRRKKIMLQTIKTLNKDIQLNCKNIDPKIQRRINLKIRDYNKQISELKSDITKLKTAIIKDIEIRDEIIKTSKTQDKKTKGQN